MSGGKSRVERFNDETRPDRTAVSARTANRAGDPPRARARPAVEIHARRASAAHPVPLGLATRTAGRFPRRNTAGSTSSIPRSLASCKPPAAHGVSAAAPRIDAGLAPRWCSATQSLLASSGIGRRLDRRVVVPVPAGPRGAFSLTGQCRPAGRRRSGNTLAPVPLARRSSRAGVDPPILPTAAPVEPLIARLFSGVEQVIQVDLRVGGVDRGHRRRRGPAAAPTALERSNRSQVAEGAETHPAIASSQPACTSPRGRSIPDLASISSSARDRRRAALAHPASRTAANIGGCRPAVVARPQEVRQHCLPAISCPLVGRRVIGEVLHRQGTCGCRPRPRSAARTAARTRSRARRAAPAPP